MVAYKPGTAIYLEIDSSMWRFCIENALIKQELPTGRRASGFFNRYPSPSTPYFSLSNRVSASMTVQELSARSPLKVLRSQKLFTFSPPQLGFNFQRLHYN
ncbi:hypothetical protein QUA56_24675 [Microcoleus sp. N3A4]|uniref:hypothetical protein n=1 Tax=Microcoleus sp. N3A4 TaxID=3055379 RepID=UPI002FD57241